MEEMLRQQMERAAPAIGLTGAGTIQPPTMTERLRERRDMLRKHLDEVEAALSELEGNPDVARVVDAISRLGHF